MPRNGSGVYSADWVNASPNTTIESAKQNAMVADLVADANAARPVTAGGTGATTAIGAADNLFTKSSDVASATTTDLSTATGMYVVITGTTTITAFGTEAAGVTRVLRFSGALTLTHNSTSLILPGAASITTAAGDTAIFVSEGSGNWRCIEYSRSAAEPSLYVLRSALSTSASTIDFTDIPPGVKRISLILNGLSTNGSASVLAQLGTAGGWITSGYAGSRVAATSGAAVAAAIDASGVFVAGGNTDATYSGIVSFVRLGPGSSLWAFQGATGRSDLASYSSPAGIVSAGAEVTRIRINAGADTRDAGSVSISYEL